MISKELLKGSLKPVVLKILSEHVRMYGYELNQKVEEASNGRIRLTFGALYPILHKLEDDGDLVTDTEIVNSRMRIYYRLTTKGRNTASVKIAELKEYIAAMQKLISGDYGVSLSSPV